MGEMDGLEVTDCTKCPELVDCRSRIVNGTGPADADVVFVGEGPGEQEDREGEPFVGRSGTILDDKLRDRGLARQDVRITNCVRCRPPENRDPTGEELDNCFPYLESEIEQVDPELIITLGKVPSQHLLDRDVAVTKEAGSIEQAELGGAVRDVLICVHPAATLYDRSQEETLDAALDKAAAMADGDSNGQSQLGDF
ncbi:uracil-DNA glycosylase [Halorussus ruber]|uniref:uracil-DNA glycosylase n=1 Tax=Halorussus ruber TaxID=1126238 RepID=UPI001091CA08|nr:uracil-DNA glycosylase [Halorussus ruber]